VTIVIGNEAAGTVHNCAFSPLPFPPKDCQTKVHFIILIYIYVENGLFFFFTSLRRKTDEESERDGEGTGEIGREGGRDTHTYIHTYMRDE
jgi:hypothetical protein